MSGDSGQTQSTSTLSNLFNFFDKLKFKKKIKCKTSGIIENNVDNNECGIQNEKSGCGNSDKSWTTKKCDNKKVFNTNKASGDGVLKDILITKIENYDDIEKFIASNNSLKEEKEEGNIACESLPFKTFEKDNKQSELVLHQKKQKLKKKCDIAEILAKEEQVNGISELNENTVKVSNLNSFELENVNYNNDGNAVDNNDKNSNNNSNLISDRNNVYIQKAESKKRKKSKQLKCKYIVENCDVMECNKDLINQLKTLPLNFNEKQLLFMEGKHIKRVIDHNKAIKHSNTLKLKKCKSSYSEKPLNSKRTNSRSKLVKVIRNDNTTVNISKSLIITDGCAENQKRHTQELSTFSVDNVNSVRGKVTNKKKKRRKILNAYHELTKPRSNLKVMENNTEDKHMLKSNENPSLCENVEENHRQGTGYLDSVPVKDSKDSSIHQCKIMSGKDNIIQPSIGINNKVLEKCFHSNHPKDRQVFENSFHNKEDVHSNEIIHAQGLYSQRKPFTGTAKEKSIDIEVNLDNKPNEHYNFLIENKHCRSSTKHIINNTDFPHDSIRNKLIALKTTLKNKVVCESKEDDSRQASDLKHSKKSNKVLNKSNDTFKKSKSASFNKPAVKYTHADHFSKQKRLPYSFVKKTFIPDMENKEYISVANVRIPLNLKSKTQNEIPIHTETKFKACKSQHTNKAVRNSKRENKLKESNNKNFNNFKCCTNFCGDCFVDKEVLTNEAACKCTLNNSSQNIKVRDKGDYMPDESEILANQFNRFVEIIKNWKAENSEPVESIINENDFLLKCLKLANSENNISSSRDNFVRLIESTEIENWKSRNTDSGERNTKPIDSLQKSSKFVNSENNYACSRYSFERVTDGLETEQKELTENNPMRADSKLKFSNFLKHKYVSVPKRNNFVRVVKSSHHSDNQNTENYNKQYLNNFLENRCFTNNNTTNSVSSRERIFTDISCNENKMSSTKNHPMLSVNFVNISKNKLINSLTGHSELYHNGKQNFSNLETQTLPENGMLNKKMPNDKISYNSPNSSGSDFKFSDNFMFPAVSIIKNSMDSNDVGNTKYHYFNCHRPETCGKINEEFVINRKCEQLYALKKGDSGENFFTENEQKVRRLGQSKHNSQCGSIIDFTALHDIKSIQNVNYVGVKHIKKSLSDSNLSVKSLGTGKIMLKNNDCGGRKFTKTKYKSQQKIISKDMGINTDIYATESEYLFNKCISILTEHLAKIYELCDRKKSSCNESGNESSSDNVNFKMKDNGSGYSFCRDDFTGHIKLPYTCKCRGEYHKAYEEMYNLLLLMLTNNMNVSEMSERNDAFVTNLRDVVCQYTEKRFKELNKSIAELSKKVNEVVEKNSNYSVKTSNLNSNSKIIRNSIDLQNDSDHSEAEVGHKTSEILELMKVIENTDINTSGCSDLSFLENKDYKRNCEISENKNNVDSKNVMRFQVEVQLNDSMQVDKIVIEGS